MSTTNKIHEWCMFYNMNFSSETVLMLDKMISYQI